MAAKHTAQKKQTPSLSATQQPGLLKSKLRNPNPSVSSPPWAFPEPLLKALVSMIVVQSTRHKKILHACPGFVADVTDPFDHDSSETMGSHRQSNTCPTPLKSPKSGTHKLWVPRDTETECTCTRQTCEKTCIYPQLGDLQSCQGQSPSSFARPGTANPRPKHQASAPSLPISFPSKWMSLNVLFTFNASARACGQKRRQTMWNLRTYKAICDTNIKPCPPPTIWSQDHESKWRWVSAKTR